MASYISAALGVARQWQDQLKTTTEQMETLLPNHEYTSRMMLHQMNKLYDAIQGTENYYAQILRLIRLDTGSLYRLKPVELQGSIPLAYFHFPSLADRLLIARAERMEEWSRRRMPGQSIRRIF